MLFTNFPDKFFDIHLVDVEVIRSFQDMILLTHNLLHISVQMFPKQFPVRLLFKKPCKELIHIVKHILQRLVKPPGVYQGCSQHA